MKFELYRIFDVSGVLVRIGKVSGFHRAEISDRY